ncbi:MAG TPA: hypothetical protein VHY32_05280 [Caulobacteraceae bacterium]|jgi:hypothetical protein|nr:hypothetical protein [Caulobacteraceae bacterium]
MRKILTAALAALTIGGAVAATTTPAEAAPYGWHGGFHGRGYGPGIAVGAGLLGLAVGASLAGPHYYGPGPYYGPYAYGPAYGYYGGCRVHYRWDPYTGRSIPVERCY